jgi:hypothetical protein
MLDGSNYFDKPAKNDVENLWEKSQENKLIRDLKEGRNLQEVMESLDNFQEAFTTLDVIVCSDGRVLPSSGAKLGLAGEGILLSQEELDHFIVEYKGKIAKVTSHEDCGAAGKAFKDQKIETGTADELGENFAEWLAKQLGATYEHIPMKDMKNSVHNERAICFDGTGKFNPATLTEMPGHFVSSGFGFGLSEEYMKEELGILTGIALGDHGFGKRFTGEDKFYIIVSAKDAQQLEEMKSIAKEAVAKFGDSVDVVGFVHETGK